MVDTENKKTRKRKTKKVDPVDKKSINEVVASIDIEEKELPKNTVPKGKLLVVQYNYVGGMGAQYSKFALIRARVDFSMREEKQKSRLNGKNLLDHLVKQKVIKYENYLITGLGGVGDCVITKRIDT